ncbi:hypothetical protein AAFF_G00098470 [Aldrovandia affinis]|uniref:UEV domain-containing protein n=1 Tax=Aldrovandia affinis TaxID=143900 RepID=A0AAD7WBF2_9TELE|nr:hypothetical protein AAFF_G00098470 [Aldrovandia affinis]
MDTYPYNPPICFVKPTSAMMIKTSNHTDPNDKIYLPYLHEWKHKYKYTDLVVQDILGVISQYKDLKYAMNSYVFNDGSTRELMSLSGSIPVDYRGNVYNIPMCLWLMDTYPTTPPSAL